MTASLWTSFGSVFAILLLGVTSPGPSFLVVSRLAMTHSRRAGFAAALGVALGDFLFAALAMSGLSVILLPLHAVSAVIRLAGAVYLIWLGIQAWRGAGRPVAFAGDAAPPGGFRTGLAVCFTNPQAITFFVSLFAAAIAPGTPLWMRVAVAALVFAVALAWYSFVALAFSAERVRAAYARIKIWTDRAFGALLIAVGLRLAVAR